MIYGYVRVSTKSQKLDRQLHELQNAVEGLELENVYSDAITGLQKDRPGLAALKQKLREGDVVYVSELSRLSRSLEDLLDIVKEFDGMGVSLHSLKEGFLFESNSVYSKLVLVVIAAVSDLERALIAERVRSGLEAARASGKRIGRPRTDAKKVEEAFQLHDRGAFSVSKATKAAGISRATYYRALRAKRAEEALESSAG